MIRILALSLTLIAGLVWAQQAAPVAASKPAPRAAVVKRHPDGRPLGIPYSATKIADGAWRAMENGKPVIYRSTAFGFSKVSEEENTRIQKLLDGRPEEKAQAPEGVSVEEREGKLYFKRITPFGNYEWVKEKDQLSAAEKAVVDRSKQTAAQGETKR
ncbi:MAG: hypothetical protein K7J46_08235 [Bryobacter sp.]|jgi:hypothetical protein|nr:hypothetical protein [Bryobacter sp. CoA8 C33]